MSILDNEEKRLGLLARFQRIADYQINSKSIDASNLGYQITSTNNINTNQTVTNPVTGLITDIPSNNNALIPLKPIKPIEPPTLTPGTQVWVHPNKNKDKEPISTQIGYAVEDPYLDSLLQSALSSDVQQRASFYDQIDLVFVNDPNAYQARENLLQGAFGQGQEQEVKPAKGFENDPDAIRMAQAANRIWQRVSKLITPQYRMQVCREYLTYGNVYVRITYDKYGVIEALRALPTKTIKVNSDQNLSFYPNQPDCYVQYTRSNYSTAAGFWPEIGILSMQNIQFQSDRYGMPFILPCLGYARGLIRGTNIIPDAREAGQPIVHENHMDAMGNKVYRSEINEARWYSLEERKNRNEPINAYRHNITNGTVKIEMLSADGAFWNELNDFTWFARGITSIFNRTFAKQVGAEVINRATLDRITENDYEGEYRLALLFAQLHDAELLTKQIQLANFAIAQINKEYGLDPTNVFIDPEKVKLVTKVKAKQLPERLIENTKLSVDLYKNRCLSKRRVVETASLVLDFDVQEEIKYMMEEGLWQQPSDPNSPNLSSDPMNNQEIDGIVQGILSQMDKQGIK